MTQFNFQRAQEYEMDYSKLWINESFEKIYAEIQRNRNDGVVNPHYVDLFFKNDLSVWEDFYLNSMKDKNCLECASGPCGVMPLWGHLMTREKVIIDPLIKDYDEYIVQTFGRSWFPEGTVMHARPVEEFVPELEGAIDGFIIFRNGIDHLEDPTKAIENLARYAAKGCKLLFWGDLKHIEDPDDGHNGFVSESAEDFETLLESVGFKIEYRTPTIRDPKKVLDYGCVATKA